MNLSKLPKEKRNHLILVVLITLVAMAALGFGLINYQYDKLKQLADKKATVETNLHKVENSIKHADQLQTELTETKKTLSDYEAGMAPVGGEYLWIINTVKNFRTDYKVEIPQFGPSVTEGDMTLFAKFPYKQVTLTIGGKAHYHDLGRFLADFENKFPQIRVLNLDLKLNTDAAVGEREKLAFTMDIVTLVKPNAS